MTKKLNSFNGEPKLKDKLLQAIKLDKQNERIIKGKYWEDDKGCCIGCGEHALCTILNDKFTDRKHKYLADKLDIPESIFHLGDGIFEGLSNEESQQFVVDFYEALLVGHDYSLFEYKIKIEILINEDFGVRKYGNNQIKKIIDNVVKLHNEKLAGDEVDYSIVLLAAESVAESVAESARSVAYSTRSAADSVALSAVLSADSAAYSAGYSADSADSAVLSAKYSARSARSARSAFYTKLANKFLEMLRED